MIRAADTAARTAFVYATSVALVAAFTVTPVSAQRGTGLPRDTTGAGGAPSLRALVESAPAASDLHVVMQRYTADRAALGRRYDIPLSPVLHARLHEFYTGWDGRLQELDAAALNDAGLADLATLRQRIDEGRRSIAAEERDRTAIAPLLPFLRDVQQLQERRRERTGVDAMETAQTIADVLKQVRSLTAAVEGSRNTALPDSLRGVTAETALKAAALIAPRLSTSSPGPLRAMLDGWFGYFNGYDPLFSWWVRKPYEELTTALDAYHAAIVKRWRPGGIASSSAVE